MNKLPRHFIFLHIPKSAGTSLWDSLAERCGQDSVVKIADRPGALGFLHRNIPAIIHGSIKKNLSHRVYFGHFVVGKFAHFNGWTFSQRKDCFYATMFREPLQRAISHFYFWKRTFVGGNRVWERFSRENWSLERFLLSKDICNLQSRLVWRFPLRCFHVVGLAEYYSESLAMLGRAYPPFSDLPTKLVNTNPERQRNDDYNIDPGLAAAFRAINQKDYDLYHEANAIFQNQRSWLNSNPS